MAQVPFYLSSSYGKAVGEATPGLRLLRREPTSYARESYQSLVAMDYLTLSQLGIACSDCEIACPGCEAACSVCETACSDCHFREI